jgi:regulator of sirC expression with transglutaminase-like and TPR domain
MWGNFILLKIFCQEKNFICEKKYLCEKKGTFRQSVLIRRLGVDGSWRIRIGSQRQLSE